MVQVPWMNKIVFISQRVLSDLSCINLRKLFNLAKSCKNMIFSLRSELNFETFVCNSDSNEDILFIMKFENFILNVQFVSCIGCYYCNMKNVLCCRRNITILIPKISWMNSNFNWQIGECDYYTISKKYFHHHIYRHKWSSPVESAIKVR